MESALLSMILSDEEAETLQANGITVYWGIRFHDPVWGWTDGGFETKEDAKRRATRAGWSHTVFAHL